MNTPPEDAKMGGWMSIGSFSAASVNSSDDSIESMSDLDPLSTFQEGLDDIEREIINLSK